MRAVVLDADAVLGLRGLGLLSPIVAAPSRSARLVITEYVRRRELRDLDRELRAYEAAAAISIELVEVRSDAGRRWRDMVKRGVHKGEAEALAWILGFKPAERPAFVSCDTGARREARARHVIALDVFDLVTAAIVHKWLTVEQARAALAVWSDQKQEQCRPSDWESFDVTYKRRVANVTSTFAA